MHDYITPAHVHWSPERHLNELWANHWHASNDVSTKSISRKLAGYVFTNLAGVFECQCQGWTPF